MQAKLPKNIAKRGQNLRNSKNVSEMNDTFTKAPFPGKVNSQLDSRLTI